MKTFWVVNPWSAAGQTGRRWPELVAQARGRLGEVEVAFTAAPLDAVRLTRAALERGVDCIVAVGGDGTVNEVVNGFFDRGRPVREGAALAVVPRGTGGDLGRTLGWDGGFAAALERLAHPRPKALDVGRLEYTTEQGTAAERLFLNVCSFGVSGLVDREVSRGPKRLGGRVSFMLGSAKALFSYADRRVRVRLDDGPWMDWDVTTVAVANGRYFGGGMCVAPAADPTDGLFDVTLWSGYGLKDFVLKSSAIYSGAHTKLPGTSVFRAQRLEAESSQEVLLDVDGEQPGRLPCRVTLLPGALRVLV